MKYMRRHTARRVIIMLIDDSAIEGTVAAADPEAIELTNAQAITGPGETRPIDGLAVIRAESILWLQVL